MPGTPEFPLSAPMVTGPAATESPHNELIHYFITMGINPQTAVGLAMKIGTMEPPPVPIANGIQLQPGGKSNIGISQDEAVRLLKLIPPSAGSVGVGAKVVDEPESDTPKDDEEEEGDGLGSMAKKTVKGGLGIFLDAVGNNDTTPDFVHEPAPERRVIMHSYPPAPSAPPDDDFDINSVSGQLGPAPFGGPPPNLPHRGRR